MNIVDQSRTKKLDAAHINGKERPVIISEILKKYIENDYIKIDLQKFEDLFIAAHNPIENSIKMLCKKCHLDYDHVDKSTSPDPNNEEEDIDIKAVEKEESELIEDLILNSNMSTLL